MQNNLHIVMWNRFVVAWGMRVEGEIDYKEGENNFGEWCKVCCFNCGDDLTGEGNCLSEHCSYQERVPRDPEAGLSPHSQSTAHYLHHHTSKKRDSSKTHVHGNL